MRWSHGFITPRPLYTGPLCPTCWNSFLPSSPEALRTHRRERPLLAREGNWREFSQQPAIRRRSWVFWHAPKLGHGTHYFTSPPKEGTASVGFEPANSGTRGQHANHQTAEAVRTPTTRNSVNKELCTHEMPLACCTVSVIHSGAKHVKHFHNRSSHDLASWLVPSNSNTSR
jgi:hypothetical protein